MIAGASTIGQSVSQPLTNPKRVLLVEPSASGHHMALYLRHVVKGLAREGIEISLLTTKHATEDPAYQLVQAELPANSVVHLFQTASASSKTTAAALLKNQFFNWWKLRQAVKKLAATDSPDIAYIPTVDWVAKAVEVLGSPFRNLPFVVLYMSPKHHRFVSGIGPKGRSDVVYDKLFKRLLRVPTLRKVLVIDEIFYEFAKGRYGALSRKIGFAPDFGVTESKIPRPSAREKIGIPESKKVILVYGSLTRRKGIWELLDALAEDGAPQDVCVLLAGRPSAQLEELMKRPKYTALKQAGRLVTQFKFHDSNEERDVFSASDTVWIAYVDGFYGSSGVLHQAVLYGLPVIANGKGLIGELVARFGLGVNLNPRNKEAVIEALRSFPGGELPATRIARKLDGFKQRYSDEEHFSAVLLALQLGHSPIIESQITTRSWGEQL